MEETVLILSGFLPSMVGGEGLSNLLRISNVMLASSFKSLFMFGPLSTACEIGEKTP